MRDNIIDTPVLSLIIVYCVGGCAHFYEYVIFRNKHVKYVPNEFSSRITIENNACRKTVTEEGRTDQ